VAFVEVKNRPGLDPSTAIAIRQSLMEYQILPPEGYFLLVTQEQAYLWAKEQAADPDAAPAQRLSMREVLATYFNEAQLERHMEGSALELVLYGWLSNLAAGGGTRPGSLAGTNVFDSFANAVRDTKIEVGALL
jgi:hypothetical protein